MSMIRIYHTHKLQTNPWHREEEPHNNLETPGRQTKQTTSNWTMEEQSKKILIVGLNDKRLITAVFAGISFTYLCKQLWPRSGRGMIWIQTV